MTTDKIKEELEKEIECSVCFKKNGLVFICPDCYTNNLRRIEKATKQAMIKEFEKMIDERMNDIPDVFENSRQMSIYEELKELKQKLGELK